MYWFYLGENGYYTGYDLDPEEDCPIFLEFIPSPRGNGPWNGAYILTDGILYYRTRVKRLYNTSVHVTCYKKSCKYRVNLKMISIFDHKVAGFHDRSNFVVKPCDPPMFHTCEGYRTIDEAREPR